VGGLVAEARLLEDHGGDEGGIQALVGGLLADDVLVAQGQGDLAHRLSQRPDARDGGRGRRAQHGRDHDGRDPTPADGGASGCAPAAAGGLAA
jgi:hypothetical protein